MVSSSGLLGQRCALRDAKFQFKDGKITKITKMPPLRSEITKTIFEIIVFFELFSATIDRDNDSS